MDAIAEFVFGIGGLIALGAVIAFLVGWYVIASRSKKLKETT